MARLTNGGLIGKQVTTPTSSSASGKWNLSEQNIYRSLSIWPEAIFPKITIGGLSRPLGVSSNGLQLYIPNPWAVYQNLPSYLTGLVATTSINDTDSGMSWSTTDPVRVYMIRSDGVWNAVTTSGWTLLESNKEYISGYSAEMEVFYRDYAAGIYTGFDNNSAMYLWGSNSVAQDQIFNNGLALYLEPNNKLSYSGSGTTWTDLSGNARNATLVSSPTYSSSNGGAIDFVSSSYAQLPANNFNFGTGDYTIESWVNLSSSTTNNIIFASQSSNQSGFYALGFNSSIGWFHTTFNGSTRPATTMTPVPSANTWYHAVAVRESSVLKLYINNVASTSNGSTSLSVTSADPRIAINPASGDERWTGRIASLRIYNRALSASEVSTNFNSSRSRFGV